MAGQVQPVCFAGGFGRKAGFRLIAKDAGGQIWLGTSRGLAALRGDRFEPVQLPELEVDLQH